jgi:hypothetical protein
MPLWHSLLYSTGYMLLVCGVPLGVSTAFFLPRKDQISSSDAIIYGGILTGATLLLGAGSLLVARLISKQQNRI